MFGFDLESGASELLAAAPAPAPALRAETAALVGRMASPPSWARRGAIDRLIAARGYQGRSEAIRDLARAGLRETMGETEAERPCVAALVYVYDHTRRELSKRLTRSSQKTATRAFVGTEACQPAAVHLLNSAVYQSRKVMC